MTKEYDELHSPQFYKNVDEYAAAANIPVDYILNSASGKIPSEVEKWLIQYHKRPSLMLNLNNSHWKENEVAFFMAGVLTRNLIAAKVLSMPQFFDMIDARKISEPSCLMLPFFHGQSKVEIADWKQTIILDALRERELQGKKTVLTIRNKANLATVFGAGIVEFLQEKYEMVAV